MQYRKLLLPTLALAVLCFANGAALGQSTTVAQKRLVTVKIKNGPLVRGRLIQSDKDSIKLEVEKASCGITLEMSEVASIVYADQDLAGNTAEVSLASSAAPKAPRQAVNYRHKSRRSYR